MAVVRALRGMRFNTERVNLGSALAPPYDVIADAERTELYARDPHNVVRIDYGVDLPDDRPGVSDRYTRSAHELESWLSLGILRRDQRPSIYVHDHSFSTEDGRRLTRRGVFGRVRALPWESSDVLPHERTLRGPKEDRLRLMRSTRAQTSGVLLMWDRAPVLAEMLADATDRPADERASAPGELDVEEHALWVVDDPAEVGAVIDALDTARLYVADGHHRFETAAAYAAERRGAEPGAPEDADFAWTLAYLCAAADPTLEVLPTHRLVLPATGVPESLAALVARLAGAEGGRFRVEPMASLQAAVAAARPLRATAHAIAVAGPDGAALLVAPRVETVGPRARLDVSVVQEAILERACGITPDRIAGGALAYARHVDAAADAVGTGRAALAICVNGCSTREIIDVSDAAEQMPQKSTYFYPKVPTGLVISPLG